MANLVILGSDDLQKTLRRLFRGKPLGDSVADIDSESIVFVASDADVAEAKRSESSPYIVVDCRSAIDAPLEPIQSHFTSAGVVKALNALTPVTLEALARRGTGNLAGTKISAFLCGDDADAKRVISGLLGEIHLTPVDCGPAANAGLLDALAMLTRAIGERRSDEKFSITLTSAPTDSSPLDRWF